VDPARCVPACSRPARRHGPARRASAREGIVMTGMDSGGRPRQAGPLADGSTTRAANGLGTADGNSPVLAVPVAFYGRTADAAGTGDSRAERHRQLALCRAVAAACGARVATGVLRRRPQRRLSLAAPAAGPVPAGRALRARPRGCDSGDRGPVVPASPAPEGTGILARLAFWRVQLVLADCGLMIGSAGEYALLGRLLAGPTYGAPPGGGDSWPSGRGQRARGSQPGQAAAGRRRRGGEPR